MSSYEIIVTVTSQDGADDLCRSVVKVLTESRSVLAIHDIEVGRIEEVER